MVDLPAQPSEIAGWPWQRGGDGPGPPLGEYVAMMEAFVAGQLTAAQFETRYSRLFLADETMRPEPIYHALNGLFADVDAFYPDPAIRGPDGLAERQLRSSVVAALAALRR